MKKNIIIFIAFLSVLFLVSACTSTLPKRLDRFVSSIENNYSSFSTEDWEKANEKFEKLFEEYKQNRNSFNDAEKKEINATIARYAKVVAKSKIDGVMGTINDISSQLPTLIDGAKSWLQDLGISF